MTEPDDLEHSLEVLVAFLGEEALTSRIARLEHDLAGREVVQIPELLASCGVDRSLLRSSMLVRSRLGRISDLIHAAAIALALPHLLEPDENLLRPSLAAGNDPSRPFDVETDRRIAEFKLARWDGSDATRKRQVFKDLVQLAADESDRRAELYVLGSRPIHFLRHSRSKASWALDRSPRERELFTSRFGSLDVPVSEFTARRGTRVSIVDLEVRLPDLFRGYDEPAQG